MRLLPPLVFASVLAQEVILVPGGAYPSASLGAVYSFRAVEPYASSGHLLFNGSKLAPPYAFNTMTLLTYLPSDPYVFQTLDYDENAPLFDSFNIEYTVIDGANTTTANFSVGVAIIDAYVRTTPDVILWVNGSAPTIFDLPVGTQKDRRGTHDGLISRYAMRNPDNGLIHAGFRFTNVDWIFDDSCSTPISVNSSYLTTTFCAVYTGPNSSFVQRFPYIAAGRQVYTASIGYVTLASFGVTRLCDVCNVSVPENSTSADTRTYVAHGDGTARFTLIIERFPEGVDVYLGDVPVTAVTTDMGIVPRNLSAAPRSSFFTEHRFGDANGPASTNYSDGTPIVDCDADGVCASKLVFRLLGGGVDFGAFEVRISVFRVIDSDTLSLCASCFVQGAGPGGYGFALPGASDGRQIPDYLVRVLTLPANGTLYNANVTVGVGDVLFARSVDLYYDPFPGYFNRYYYATAPEITLSVTDDFGNVAPETDHFAVELLSSYFALTPVQGQINLLVSTTNGSRLTSCPATPSGGNFWEAPCVAVGMESNAVYGEYATPVYLDFGGAFVFESPKVVVTRFPMYGVLYKNLGSHTEPVFGPRVRLMEHLDDPSILYVGASDYSNQRDASFVNLLGEPLGGCADIRESGCPDTFAFKVVTTVPIYGANRTSPAATYSVYIVALSSESVISASQESVMVPGGGVVTLPFSYHDPDNGEAYVLVEIVSYDAVFGSVLSGLPDCFAMLNCSDQIQIYVVDKLAKDLIENIVVVVEANYTLEEERTVFISVIKRPEQGFLITDIYIPATGDLVIAADVVVYADPEDDDPYYFDGCDQDDCEEYYASQNAIAFAQQIMNYIALATGLIAPLITLFGVLAVWWMFCSRGQQVLKVAETVAGKHRAHKARAKKGASDTEPLIEREPSSVQEPLRGNPEPASGRSGVQGGLPMF